MFCSFFLIHTFYPPQSLTIPESTIELEELGKGCPPIMVGDSKDPTKEYAEYFMPVNETKKGFRQEKMYVNKSVGKEGNCRRYIDTFSKLCQQGRPSIIS